MISREGGNLFERAERENMCRNLNVQTQINKVRQNNTQRCILDVFLTSDWVKKKPKPLKSQN